MLPCNYCKTQTNVTYKCPKCGNHNCNEHRLPETHECKTIKKIHYQLISKKIEKETKIETNIDPVPKDKVAHIENKEESEAIEVMKDEPPMENIVPKTETIEDIKNEAPLEKKVPKPEIKETPAQENLYSMYRDQDGKSKKWSRSRSSNWIKIMQALGKWMLITGSFYLILYGLAKLANFMMTYRL